MAVNKGGTVERESLFTPSTYKMLGLLWGGKTLFMLKK